MSEWSAFAHPIPPPGQCVYCRCTESSPCTLPSGETCAWRDRLRIVCSAPKCLAAYAAECRRRAFESERTLRRTPAQVHAEMLAERRAKRRQARERARRKGAA